METVLIVIHLVIVVIMAGVILLQRSEGGALGIGGGGGSGGFTSRGSGNVMTRITAILATLFFLTSITLTILGNYGGSSILDRVPGGSGDGTIQPLAPIAPSDSSSTAPAPQVPAGNTEGPQVPTGN